MLNLDICTSPFINFSGAGLNLLFLFFLFKGGWLCLDKVRR